MDFLSQYLEIDEFSEYVKDIDVNIIKDIDYDLFDSNVELLKRYGIDNIKELILFDIGIFMISNLEDRVKLFIDSYDNYLDVYNNDMGVFVDYIYSC